ncbi:hypothetical protein J2X72_000590 [Phyllobacterium sp. 1468]|uniref:DUF2852 domain-containing protein n=1 Tax=Phyllobacterium sp. 1468 TaxID=2817759 RepID=UPI001AEA5055|nr:DUF2852 domain-containing protein [Phyllobacterium sp. 1468]MDR6631819.1 hypothetical protein [Phyllobacterium sp. 1468]
MNTSALIRPGWSPATIALMIIGFMLFWPLGLAMLAYIVWGNRFGGFKHEMNNAADNVCGAFRRRSQHFGRGPFGTGNIAFDEWREKELQRLDEERRKLEEMRTEFEDYARELRRAKDREEFDRFMAERNAAPKPSGSVPGVNDADQE